MTSTPLDRPVWHGLRTRQSEHGAGGDLARRFRPDIAPFAAAANDTPEALAALGALIEPGESVMLLQREAFPSAAGLIIESLGPGVQMVLHRLAPPRPPEVEVVALTEADAPEMLALATLTQPGPFRAGSHRLGDFVGIMAQGRLLAMAGERLKPPGYTEVSGVCTHPDARGRGYAGLLSHRVSQRILARGETPFLHAWAGNTAAISLYETLGFRLRGAMAVTVVRRD